LSRHALSHGTPRHQLTPSRAAGPPRRYAKSHMRRVIGALLLLGAAATPSIAPAAQPQLKGSWEAARGANDERLYVILAEAARAKIVTKSEAPRPGAPDKRPVGLSPFGKWTRQGGDVVITYSNTNIKDHLRYVAREPLKAVGLSGGAPAL